jgi:serine protease Do
MLVRSLSNAALAAAICLTGIATAPAADQVITRDTFREVSKKVSPAVVNVKVKSGIVISRNRGKTVIPPSFGLDDEMREYLERLFERQMPGMSPGDEDEFKYSRSGSGVIIREDGYVVTSNHVIADVNPDDIEITLPDERSFGNVKLVGSDDLTDLAVLKVEASGLPHVTWGDSDKLEVGDIVVAVGNPLEFNNSVSEGIVSAKHRVIKKAPIEDLIQTTAMINPGNSGGALVNLDGELIGINMAIATSTGMWSGLGFAIPSKTAKAVTDQIITSGKVGRGYLGIEMSPLTGSIAKQLGYDQNFGIVVKNVRQGSAAEKAGLQRYDIIAKVNDKEIREIYDMHRNVGARAAGESVDIQVYRDEGDGKLVEKKLKVQLDERPTADELAKAAPGTPRLPGKKAADGDMLGLSIQPAQGGKGVVVDGVEEGSRAALAGIQKGDVILQVNKKDVNGAEDLKKALKGGASGEHLFYIERKGTSAIVTISGE